jgi:peptidyl-prolyl cis-trans isomerase C
VKKVALYLVALAATAALAQETKPAAPATGTQAKSDPVIITAGSLQIHQSEFESALKTIPAEYQQQLQSGPGRKQFADDYLRMRLLSSEAVKAGLENDPDVKAQLALLKTNLLANAELQQIEKNVKVSDAELQKAYDAQKDSFDQAKARHILIAFKGSPAAQPGKKELTEEEAKAKAEEIRTKIAAGADFAELAKKESDDAGSGARGGDLGSFGRNQMVPEFDKAVFAGKVGEVGPVVRTDYGYHVIQVQERKLQPLAEVKDQLEKELKQQKMQEQLDGMKAAAGAVYNEAYFGVPAPAAAAPAASVSPASTSGAAAAAASSEAPKPTKKP